jgi:ribonucleoside-diphosphate reductase alpha chain
MTRNPDIRFAKSIVDYIFRWLATKFLSNDAQYHAGVNNREERNAADGPAAAGSPSASVSASGMASGGSAPAFKPAAAAAPKPPSSAKTYAAAAIQNQEDAPPCSMCGSIMVRSGSCYKCANCGSTSGCA